MSASIDDLKLPSRGFTRTEREWLRNELIPWLKMVRGIAGRNVTISEDDSGEVINAADCPPCS